MKYITSEDKDKLVDELGVVIDGLGGGLMRADSEFRVGDDEVVAKVKGYWVKDMLRIDIDFGGK